MLACTELGSWYYSCILKRWLGNLNRIKYLCVCSTWNTKANTKYVMKMKKNWIWLELFIVYFWVCRCGPKLGAVPSLGAPGGHRSFSPPAATTPSQHHCPEPRRSLYNVANNQYWNCLWNWNHVILSDFHMISLFLDCTNLCVLCIGVHTIFWWDGSCRTCTGPR